MENRLVRQLPSASIAEISPACASRLIPFLRPTVARPPDIADLQKRSSLSPLEIHLESSLQMSLSKLLPLDLPPPALMMFRRICYALEGMKSRLYSIQSELRCLTSCETLLLLQEPS